MGECGKSQMGEKSDGSEPITSTTTVRGILRLTTRLHTLTTCLDGEKRKDSKIISLIWIMKERRNGEKEREVEKKMNLYWFHFLSHLISREDHNPVFSLPFSQFKGPKT